MIPLHCHLSLSFLPQGNHRTEQGLPVTKRTCTSGLEVTKLKKKLEGGVIILQLQITYSMRCLAHCSLSPKTKPVWCCGLISTWNQISYTQCQSKDSWLIFILVQKEF